MLYGEFKSRFKNDEEHNVDYVIEDTRKRVIDEKQPKQRKLSFFKWLIVFILVLIIICCSALLACDFLLPQGLNSVLQLFDKEVSYYYTLLWGSYDSLKEARTQADGLKLQGGAGYIFYDGKYRVFLSYYPTKKDAQKVADKGDYDVYPIIKSTLSITDVPISNRETVRDILGIEDEILNELYSISASLENGAESATQCADKITALSARITKKTQLFFEEDITNGKLLKLKSAIDITKAVLKNISDDKITTTYLSDIREATILIAFTFSGL